MISRAAVPHAQFSRRLLTAALASVSVGLLMSASAGASGNCDRVAAPGGSDSAAGTVDAPYATAQKLINSLTAGQMGCLRTGTFNEGLSFSHGGASGGPITLTTYPGDQRATVVGRMWLKSGSDYITVSNLNLNGVNSAHLPSPTVDDAYATFTGDDVTNNHTAICFNLGDDSGAWGRAQHTLIQGNRIHHCGVIPANNHDHGIYVDASDYAQILDNVIYNNSDRAVQLYPDAQHTTVKRNVMDSNGEGVLFSGDFGIAASDNLVSNNVITNSNVRNNVESWYPSGNPLGQANLVTNSCIHGGVYDSGNGGIDASGGGFSLSANTNASPGYASASSGDFTLSPSSPCASLLAGSTAPLQPFPLTAGSPPTQDGGPPSPPPPPADTTPPTVTGTTPAAAAGDVTPGATVSVSFSEAMNQNAAQAGFSLTRSSDGATVSGTFSWSANTMTFTPAVPLDSGTAYSASVSTAATDSSGNALQSPSQWGFTVRSAQSVTGTPSSTTLSTGSVASGGASSLSAADGAYFTVNSGGHRNRNMSWYGTVAGVPSTLQNLAVNVTSKSSATCNQTLSIYKFSSSSWVTLNTRSLGTSPVALGVAVPGTLIDYVSAGRLRVRLGCSASGSFAHSTDLLSVTYTTT